MNERNKKMSKSVLVIGGSAFTGRVFSIKASRSGNFDLHVVNRGQFPLRLEGVTEYKCDRHSPRMIARLVPEIKYDALIDFCAYKPGEIKSVIDALKDRISQYIFFSTASVYEPAGAHRITESGRTISAAGRSGPVDEYVLNKLALEKELIEACEAAGIKYTIFRPTFIFGPFNYVPRESFFIELIARKHVVPIPSDATSHFCFVYVMDIAEILMKSIGNKKTFDQVFNLSGKENTTYAQLISDFERYNGGPFESRVVTVKEALDESIPLPFPLTETILYNGEKIENALDFEYTPFAEGMENTFRIFYSLFTT